MKAAHVVYRAAQECDKIPARSEQRYRAWAGQSALARTGSNHQTVSITSMNLGSAGARTCFHLHTDARLGKKPRHHMANAFPMTNAEAIATDLLEMRAPKKVF
jgi:hypothetical protein